MLRTGLLAMCAAASIALGSSASAEYDVFHFENGDSVAITSIGNEWSKGGMGGRDVRAKIYGSEGPYRATFGVVCWSDGGKIQPSVSRVFDGAIQERRTYPNLGGDEIGQLYAAIWLEACGEGED